MDIATILGIISGVGLILISITMNSGLELFVNIPSIMIVAGGTLAATLIAFPLHEVLMVLSLLRRIFFHKRSDARALITQLVELGVQARKGGVLSVENQLAQINNEYLRKGLQLVVDGVSESGIINMLKIEEVNTRKRHQTGWEIFAEMGKYSPAFGLVGTLIGLIQMLANLDEPSTIGPRMAVAMITTFYGSIMANLIFIPMSVKLKRRSQEEAILMSLVMEGIKSIRSGENPKLMEDKLNKFLSNEQQKKIAKSLKKGRGAKKKPADKT
ncbi:MAG: motility protein A [Candidatus Marinimicrobia bacterium]|nr:motility protein A [Candidatus Neomarinimicrobiota bacterium]MCF7841118.1 motility protein A [Candidatus Neomarinimicrobiota bacterium]MCF7901792.1 motility protein A [Candidatus Neomarinimicrobiota bacterium]